MDTGGELPAQIHSDPSSMGGGGSDNSDCKDISTHV